MSLWAYFNMKKSTVQSHILFLPYDQQKRNVGGLPHDMGNETGKTAHNSFILEKELRFL